MLPTCDQTYANGGGSSAHVAPAAAEAAARLKGFTNASPDVIARQVQWHQKGADLLAMMDGLLARRQAVDPIDASAERHIAEARAILAAIRCALAEVFDGSDPIGEAISRVSAALPPLAPAAAEAICDLSDAEISAVRALKLSPPPAVRLVCVCVCTLLRAASHDSATPHRGSMRQEGGREPDGRDPHGHLIHLVGVGTSGGAGAHSAVPASCLASWEEAQAMLARPDFSSRLRGFDPRILHAQPAPASMVEQQLASLASGTPRRRSTSETRPWRQARQAAAMQPQLAVAQTTVMLNAAVRSGGRAIGQLFLWCSRVLAEARDLRERDALVEAQRSETGALSALLEEAQQKLDLLEAQRPAGRDPHDLQLSCRV